MRDAIKEYLNLTQEEKIELWKNAVFVFDTNIFLNLYRYTEVTRESLLNAMQQLSDRIWMPKQVAQELMKDRPKVIFDTLEIFKSLKDEKEKFIKDCREKLRRESTDIKIDNMSKELDKHIEVLIKESNYIENVDEDKILNQLLQLYEKKVGNGFSDAEIEEIKKEGTERYNKQTPPGYKDCKKGEGNNAFGDLIIWKEILLFAKNNKKDIIYVTGDKKEDWWEIVNGRTLGPRVELKKEFLEETKQRFNMYSMDRFLEQFKTAQGTQIQQSAIDEVKNYERIIEERHSRVRAEQMRRHEAARIDAEQHHLMELLCELNEKQESLENRIKELQHIFEAKEDLTCENIQELEKFNMLLDEFKGNQAYLSDVLQRKDNIKKELERLTWKRERLTNTYGRSEKAFD